MPGLPGLGRDEARARGQRMAELLRKEREGTLSEAEKAELDGLRAHPPHGQGRAARKARMEELEQKQSKGTLTDEEKAELERMQRTEQRFEQLKKKHEEHRAKRDERRHQAKKEALGRYPGYAKNPAARDEFKKHARRIARLERAKDVAEAEGRDDLVARIDQLLAKEKERHRRWLEKHGQPAPQGAQP